ncbi:MAG: 30S ribosome-binding factor RbfA [Anaerolineae bacterium]|nr:30S ribosome-binding factor RbfA [Anaerolineae bacterium]
MTIRQERIRELIHSRLSHLLQYDVTDPALSGVTVTEVKLDREIQYADVYVHALGADRREEEVMAGLRRANGWLRREVANRLRIRHMPNLHFHWDHQLQAADHIEALLDTLKDETSSAGTPPPEENSPRTAG